MSYPKKYNALKVSQPFGEFFAISIKAIDLLEVTFSDVLRYNEDGSLSGSQRLLDEKKRLKEISDYIDSQDLAFPNSIIIAANYNEEGFIVNDDEDKDIRWSFDEKSKGIYEITIPSSAKIAAIIDGQHRLKGFKDATLKRQMETDLIVAVYFDLPSPYQAYIFASINYNQKPVSKSLALEQFGYLTTLSPQNTWSPELLSVFLVRKLNTDKESSFFNHIKVAPQNDEYLLEINPKEQEWLVSTATVVEGILRLISINPKRDSNALNKLKESERLRSLLPKDNSVLRKFYLDNNDVFIYKVIVNYFNAVNEVLFVSSKDSSFIKKTVGIQALFNVLRIILTEKLEIDKNISFDYFKSFLEKIKDIDFSDNFFTASGIGKSRIQNVILIKLGYKKIDDIRKEEEKEDYERLTKFRP
ncbi:MAG: DGQHR domain-containing protein [Flavobacteriaceae bacterium]